MKEIMDLEGLTPADILERLKTNWLDQAKEMKVRAELQTKLDAVNKEIDALEKEHFELMNYMVENV